MSNDDEVLAHWWAALSAEDQAEAVEADRRGRLTPKLQSSLMSTGMLSPSSEEKPEKVPRALHDFLKMRH